MSENKQVITCPDCGEEEHYIRCEFDPDRNGLYFECLNCEYKWKFNIAQLSFEHFKQAMEKRGYYTALDADGWLEFREPLGEKGTESETSWAVLTLDKKDIEALGWQGEWFEEAVGNE